MQCCFPIYFVLLALKSLVDVLTQGGHCYLNCSGCAFTGLKHPRLLGRQNLLRSNLCQWRSWGCHNCYHSSNEGSNKTKRHGYSHSFHYSLFALAGIFSQNIFMCTRFDNCYKRGTFSSFIPHSFLSFFTIN